MIFWIASYPKNGNTWLGLFLVRIILQKMVILRMIKFSKIFHNFQKKNILINFEYDKSNPFLQQDIGLKHKRRLI